MIVPYPLVEVIWIDAYTSHGWEEQKFKVEEQVVITVGFLIAEDKKGLCIASSTGKDGSHNARIVIPKGMVKEKRILKCPKKTTTPPRKRSTTESAT